jgi:hypothetical protein
VNNGPPNSAPVTLPLNATNTPFSIGADVAPAGSSGSYVDGRVASVGLWKRVLSPAERTILYNNGVPPPHDALSGPLRTKLLSWWDLTENSGTRADAQGPNSLTDHNGVTSVLGTVPDVDLINDGMIGGNVTVGNLGMLGGSGTIAGNVTVNPGGIVNFDQNGATIQGNVLNNGLFIVSSGAQFTGSGPSFTNNGTLDLSTASGFTWPSGFVNNGLILDSRIIRAKNISKTDSSVSVAIDSYTGHTYQLQVAPAPDGSFVNADNLKQGSTGTTLTFIDSSPNPAGGFYRIAVDP